MPGITCESSGARIFFAFPNVYSSHRIRPRPQVLPVPEVFSIFARNGRKEGHEVRIRRKVLTSEGFREEHLEARRVRRGILPGNRRGNPLPQEAVRERPFPRIGRQDSPQGQDASGFPRIPDVPPRGETERVRKQVENPPNHRRKDRNRTQTDRFRESEEGFEVRTRIDAPFRPTRGILRAGFERLRSE